MVRSLLILICLLKAVYLVAQSPASDFSIKSAACIGESLEITNLSANALDYQWDFCLDDIRNFKQSEKILTISGLSSGTHYKLKEANGLWFAFVTSHQNNKIFRLDFGDNINNIPSITDLGSFGELIVEPYSIDVGFHNGEWFGFVSSLLANQGVVKLQFGNSLANTPAASNIGNFGFDTNYIDLQIIYQSGDALLALIANGVLQGSDGSLVTVNFKDSFDNVPASGDIFSAPVLDGGNTLRGFDLIKKNGNWIGFYSASGGSKIIKLDFGSNIQTAALSNSALTFNGVSSPFEINILQEGSKYFGIVSNLSFQIAFIDFGALEGETPVEMLTPTLPTLFSATIVRHNGKTFIQGASLSNDIHHIIFEAPCSSTLSFSSNTTPPVFNFTSSGIKEIELIAKSGLEGSVAAKSVNILSLTSPGTAFSTNGFVCAANPVMFIAENTTGDITAYSWNYGDATKGSGITSQHTYSPGNYEVRLEITATNGCKNVASENLKIYPEPVADFVIPLGLLCTNDQFSFPSTTPDIYDGNLTHQWYVDNNLVSQQRDLQYTFTTTGIKEIKLQNSIPGCSGKITKTTSPIETGTVVDFSFTGICEGEIFGFKNEILEGVESYVWDFNDGQTSADPNPTHTFTSFGDYSVSLTATNTIGCQNKATEIIKVRSKPMVDFVVAGPPLSCSGTATPFTNQSINPDGRNVATWLWNFGDANNPISQNVKNPEHVFRNAGPYLVSVSAITEFGCEATAQKEITITQSPSTDFTVSPACKDLPVIFTGPSGNGINDWYWEVGTAYYLTATPIHTFKAPGDYPVYLAVTSSNGCTFDITTVLHVPKPLVPDFSFLKNCIDQQTIFTDITDGEDPIVSRQWDFGGIETSTLSPASYSFNEGGMKTIKLKVTAQSGCNYLVSKQVDIIPSPVAGFSASPSSGAQPLEVQFINTSSHASEFLWKFSDGTGANSTEFSPVFTFHEVGQHEVELIATNTQQCEDIFRSAISTVAPLPDVDLEMISISANPDGSFKLIVTINNKGNTVLKNLPVEIDFSGAVKLREIVEEPIGPASKYNLVFSTGIANLESLRYICVSADLINDLSPQGNQICKEFKNILFVFPAYPNPAKAILNLEWISEKNKTVRISLSDAMGRNVLASEFMADQGLNQEVINLSAFQNGIYYLIINDGFTKSAQKILISGKP